MRRKDIDILIDRLVQIYGDDYSPWGTSPDENEGTGFQIAGSPVTFSIMCVEPTPEGKYDFQIEAPVPDEYIESTPMDAYLHAGEIDLDGLLKLIPLYKQPFDQWP